ncbi:4Fe-4S binding protein [Sporanaerobacter acetigenes]|uniref:4Fe-4S binding protein n=1 Tax=Sporanaerobacter acetigenes TaxID=165813 RepID=UPI0018EE7634|nr:4Fe-4S binding protein [Sporanaerobacter acetigenes]
MKELKKHNVQGPVATTFTASNTGSWRLERPKVNFEECIKCGTCAMVCPVNIVEIKKEEKECVVFDFNYCKGCGICANECPKKCISMVPERSEV